MCVVGACADVRCATEADCWRCASATTTKVIHKPVLSPRENIAFDIHGNHDITKCDEVQQMQAMLVPMEDINLFAKKRNVSVKQCDSFTVAQSHSLRAHCFRCLLFQLQKKTWMFAKNMPHKRSRKIPPWTKKNNGEYA